ncbi:hypothetical protein [Streptomyces phaeofaciens]|uniref:hypothetical protein n=1 Tax=Streptomyces phaeofaciens TaxID=68254 RepID=UPI0016795C81|nr:hypothetical protein [Streptomyces phaeofaciens]
MATTLQMPSAGARGTDEADPAALVKLRAEGLVEQITLARASRMRVRFPTQ